MSIDATFKLLEVHCDYMGCPAVATDTKTSLDYAGWFIDEKANKTYCMKHRLARHVDTHKTTPNGPHVKRSINGKFGYHD